MNEQKTAIRAGAALIAFAVFLRLLGGGFFLPIFSTVRDPGVFSLLIYLQTGRVIRWPSAVQTPEPTAPGAATGPTEPTDPPVPFQKPVFSGADVAAVPVTYGCDYRPDISEALLSELSWDLTGEAPTVLIVHTHASEAYTPASGDEYVSDGGTRTLDDRYNMVSIGEEVRRILEEGGIHVIHDRTHHDYPSYSGAYNNARQSITAILERYPTITMVLDIHRDAMDASDGSALTTHATVDGLPSSQVMILVGTDYAGGYHPGWKQNLSVGLKLSALMERENPGVTKAVNVYPHRLNMDKTMGSLLVEVGASGDTHEMAMRAAGALARAILELSRGSS